MACSQAPLLNGARQGLSARRRERERKGQHIEQERLRAVSHTQSLNRVQSEARRDRRAHASTMMSGRRSGDARGVGRTCSATRRASHTFVAGHWVHDESCDAPPGSSPGATGGMRPGGSCMTAWAVGRGPCFCAGAVAARPTEPAPTRPSAAMGIRTTSGFAKGVLGILPAFPSLVAAP